MNLSRIFKSPNVRNSIWIIGERVFEMLLSLVVGILSARYLGPQNYGSLNYTASFVTFFTSIATLGMDSVAVKKLIENPSHEGEYLGGCIILRLFSSALSCVAICILVATLNPGDHIKLLMAFLQSLQLIFRAGQALDYWFQKHLRSKYTSIGKMIAGILVSAYKIVLLVTAKSVVWFAFANSLSDLVITIVLIIFYVKECKQGIVFDFHKGFEVLSESYHLILSGLMVAIYSQMDKIMIGKMLSDLDVGLYTTATSICGMWTFIPTAIITSFQPMVMESKCSQSNEIYIKKLEQVYSVIIWICIGASICICVFGKFIVLTLYGNEYAGAISALQIAIWYETFSMIGSARGIWATCENKLAYVKYYLAIGVVVNLILNALLIPCWGINGAAFATLATQITTSLIAPLFFKETRIHTKIVGEAFLLKWKKDDKNERGKIDGEN